MLRKLFAWLSRHPGWTAILAGLYVAQSVLGHGPVSRFVYRVQRSLSENEAESLRRFNHLVTTILVGAALLMLPALWAARRWVRWRRVRWGYAVTSLALMAAAYEALFVVNNEAVHFGQYALLGPLLLILTGGHREAMIWTALLGVIDEAYQFFFLDSLYLDFNDVIFDILGAGAGLTLVESFIGRRWEWDARSTTSPPRLRRSPAAWTVACLFAVGSALYGLGVLRWWTTDDGLNAPIVLSKRPRPSNVWEPTAWGKTYHILRPEEGLLLAFLLVGWYGRFDHPSVGESAASPGEESASKSPGQA